MVMLVTLEQARDHLRSDTDADDADLMLKIHAASEAVARYLKNAPELQEDPAPFLIQAAVLQMVGYLYKDRDNDEKREYEQGYLPRPVTALLSMMRDPTLA